MAAHIGVGLASEPGGTLVITSMSPKGTAATSGMLRANDQLIKVDGVAVQSPQHAQQLLHGEANTIVKVKVRRRTQQGLVNLDVSLVREVGDEHNLTQKHQGFKSAYVPQNQTSAEEVWKKIEHGQARFNQSQVKQSPNRFTAEEYEAFKAQHKAEDAANIENAERMYQQQVAQDAQDAAKKPRVEEGLPAKRPEPDKTGWFAGWEDMLGLKSEGYVGMGTATKTNDKGSSPGKAGLVGVMGGGFHAGKAHHKSMKKRIHDQAVDYVIDYKIQQKQKQIREQFRHDNERRAGRAPGNHVWPWESTKKDDKFLDKDIPLPWDCGRARKPEKPRRRPVS